MSNCETEKEFNAMRYSLGCHGFPCEECRNKKCQIQVSSNKYAYSDEFEDNRGGRNAELHI